MKQSIKSFAANSAGLLAFAFVFVACSGDVSKVTDEYVKGATVLDKKQKMPACNSDNEGEVIYALDSAQSYICIGRDWLEMGGVDGEDGKDGENGKPGAQGIAGEPGEKGASCTMKAIENDESLAGIEIACGEKKDTLWSGVDGEDGFDGQDGRDGISGSLLSSCTLTKVTDEDSTRFGVEIACKNAKPDTLWSGTDGIDGERGERGLTGDGCSAKRLYGTNDNLEAIEITCGSGDSLTLDTLVNGTDGQDGATGDVLASCDLKKVVGENNRKGIEMTCGDNAPDTLWSGVDGTNGLSGSDGNKCSSKSVTSNTGVKGVEITCGDETTTLWAGADGSDGQDGASGTNGTNGAGCVAEDDGKGLVHITCGSGATESSFDIYKGWCGGKAYDPEHFDCIEGQAIGKGFVKCGVEYYNPETDACLDASIDLIAPKGWEQCGAKAFDPEVNACYFVDSIDVKGLSVCSTKLYNASTHACYFSDSVDVKGLSECGTKLYDALLKECYFGNTVDEIGLSECGTKLYDASTHACYFSDSIDVKGLSECGTKLYDAELKACYFNNTVDEKGLSECGTALYDATTEACYDEENSITGAKGLTLCGSSLFSVEGTCINGAMYAQGTMTDARDGDKEYKTMTVVTATTSQTWMADNLNYEIEDGSICGGSSGSANCATYGRLYSWTASQTACPTGWHVPTVEEWNTLICTLDANCIDVSSTTNGKEVGFPHDQSNAILKTIRTPDMWSQNTGNNNGTNETGFSAVPANYAVSGGLQGFPAWNIFWASSSCKSGFDFCHVQLTDTQFTLNGEHLDGDNYLTVRCIQDAE